MRRLNIRTTALVLASIVASIVISCSDENGITEATPNDHKDVTYGTVRGYAHYGGVKTNGIWCSFETWTTPPGEPAGGHKQRRLGC